MLWMRLRRCRRIGVMGLLLLLSACATNTVTPPRALQCADFLPEEWRDGIPGAALPDPEKPDWRKFSVEEAGQLAKANGRQRDTMAICEKVAVQQREVEQAFAPRTLWQRLTPWRE